MELYLNAKFLQKVVEKQGIHVQINQELGVSNSFLIGFKGNSKSGFSEYNAPEPSKYDFPTGIGKGLVGLLVTRFKFEKTISIKNPYLMVHLTNDDRVDVTRCFANFIKLMCKKYHKRYNKLDVIIPKHILNDSDGLQRLFSHPHTVAQSMRNWGMSQFDQLSHLKQWTIHQAMHPSI